MTFINHTQDKSNSPGAKTLNGAVSSYAVRTTLRAVAFNDELCAILFGCVPS